MRTKLKKIKKLIRKKEYLFLFRMMLNVFPSRFIFYDRFYFVRCHNLHAKNFRKLKFPFELGMVDFSQKELKRIAKDLEINIPVINFHVAGKENQTKIIRIKRNNRDVAVCFLMEVNELRSPSGYVFPFEDKKSGIWIFGTFVSPQYRLRGLHVYLIQKAYRYGKERGFDGLYGEIHYFNRESIMSHLRIGFESYKNMNYLKIVKKRIYWESDRDFWCIPAKRR